MPEDESKDITTIDGDKYEYSSKLEGRGQSGMAGFFKDKIGDSVLIKEDNPGTCLAESMAIIYNPTDSPKPNPILQAQIATADRKGKPISISIQPAFTVPEGSDDEIKSLDRILLGKKREPKTIYSEESYAASTIKEKIALFSPEVKKQLAYAIYTSQLNGDESLHTGQFMVSVNKDNGEVTSIQRCDFGALGRFGMARTENTNSFNVFESLGLARTRNKNSFDPMHTSEQYMSQGQYGKDYVSYLLQDEHVADEVKALWNQTKPEEVVQKIRDRFEEQVEKITDPELKKTALREFTESLLRGSIITLPPEDRVDSLKLNALSYVTKAATKRVEGYHSSAMVYKQDTAVLNRENVEEFKKLKVQWNSTTASSPSTASTSSETSSSPGNSRPPSPFSH